MKKLDLRLKTENNFRSSLKIIHKLNLKKYFSTSFYILYFFLMFYDHFNFSNLNYLKGFFCLKTSQAKFNLFFFQIHPLDIHFTNPFQSPLNEL